MPRPRREDFSFNFSYRRALKRWEKNNPVRKASASKLSRKASEGRLGRSIKPSIYGGLVLDHFKQLNLAAMKSGGKLRF